MVVVSVDELNFLIREVDIGIVILLLDMVRREEDRITRSMWMDDVREIRGNGGKQKRRENGEKGGHLRRSVASALAHLCFLVRKSQERESLGTCTAILEDG